MQCQAVASLFHASYRFPMWQHAYGVMLWFFLGFAGGLWLDTAPGTYAQGLSLTNVRGDPGATLTVTVFVSAAPNEVDAFAFDVTFDPTLLQYTGFQVGELLQGFSPRPQVSNPSAGRLRVGGFTTQNVLQTGQSGDLIDLSFTVLRTGNTLLVPEHLIDDMASWARQAGSFESVTSPGDTSSHHTPSPILPTPSVVSTPTAPTTEMAESGPTPTTTPAPSPSSPASTSSPEASSTASNASAASAGVAASSPRSLSSRPVAASPTGATIGAATVVPQNPAAPPVSARTPADGPSAPGSAAVSGAPTSTPPTPRMSLRLPSTRDSSLIPEEATSDSSSVPPTVATETAPPGSSGELTATLMTSHSDKRGTETSTSKPGTVEAEAAATSSSGFLSVRLQAGVTLVALLLLGAVIVVLVGTRR